MLLILDMPICGSCDNPRNWFFFPSKHNDFEIAYQLFDYLLRIQRRHRMSNGLCLQLLSSRPLSQKDKGIVTDGKRREKSFVCLFVCFFLFSFYFFMLEFNWMLYKR